MRRWIQVGGVVLLLIAGAVLFLYIKHDQDRKRVRERMQQIHDELRRQENQRAQAQQRETTGFEKERAGLAERLARLASAPETETPLEDREEGNLEIRRYAFWSFEKAELIRVKGHPEAWAWVLDSPRGIKNSDFAPPGGVRDLMPDPPQVNGHQLAGLLQVIEAGPLEKAVLVHSPGTITGREAFQLATVAYHQQAPSLLMEPICDFGLVPGKKVLKRSDFKDRCHAAVAKRLKRKPEQLFPSPWLIHPGLTEPDCDREYQGRPQKGPNRGFTCRWDASEGKLTVTFDGK